MENRAKKEFLVNIAFVSAVFLLAFVAFKMLFSYCLPFVLAFIIAFSVQSPAGKLSSKIPIKKPILSGLLSAVIFLAAVGIVILCIYIFIENSNSLLKGFAKLFDSFSDTLYYLRKRISSTVSKNSPQISRVIDSMSVDFSDNIGEKLSSLLTNFATTLIKYLPNFIFNFIIALVASFYIAKDFEILKKFYFNLFGEKVFSRTVKVKNIFTENVLKMGKGYLILLSITFFELFIGFLVLGIENALLLSVLIAFVDLLPVFGTGTVLVPWGVLKLIMGQSIGIGIIILYVVITVLRNFLEPKIIGKQIGINPLFTLFAMFLGLKLLGVIGLILFPMGFIVLIKYYK